MIKLIDLLERKLSSKKLDLVGKEDGDIDNDGDKDKTDQYLLKRRKAISKSMKENHLSWPPTQDHEATMAKGELRNMINNAAKVYQMIQPNQQLPGWVSGYITLASDYMHSIAEYLTEEEIQYNQTNEAKIVATDFQFTPEQFNLLKRFGSKLSTSGNEMYIPKSIKDDLDNRVDQSEFKQEFYDTAPTSDKYLVSQIMTGIKKSLTDYLYIGNKKYYVLKGKMTKNGNFNFPNPSRKK
jgi:hypothetical protein